MKGKGRRLPGLIFAAAVLLAAGCGREELPELPDVEEEQNAGEQDAGEQNGEEQTAGEQTAGEQNAVYPRELQRGELKAFTDWIDTADDRANYGFLLSEYEDPRELDLNQLLYTGAGMETPSLTEDERQAYLEITGQPEIYTDVVRLTTEQIDGFLEQKTGYALDEMTGPFDWTYLEETDAWVHQHGDTNYMPFTCVRGWETEKGSFELECVPGDGQLTPDLYPSCRLRLARHGDDYRVLSNAFDGSIVYSRDIWKIEDQSFEVDLGGSWGQAVFTSYAPDTAVYSTQDVSFALVKNGETIYEFPDVMEDNFRSRETFLGILAVSFQDYDGDGEKDVIVICEYAPLVTTASGGTLKEVRLYRNLGDSFQLDRDKMDWLQGNDYCNTVAQVLEHVNEARADE